MAISSSFFSSSPSSTASSSLCSSWKHIRFYFPFSRSQFRSNLRTDLFRALRSPTSLTNGNKIGKWFLRPTVRGFRIDLCHCAIVINSILKCRKPSIFHLTLVELNWRNSLSILANESWMVMEDLDPSYILLQIRWFCWDRGWWVLHWSWAIAGP